MGATEELLASMPDEVSEDGSEYLTIDPDTRKISIPVSESIFGATSDMDSDRKYFRCQRIVGDNIDLSQHKIYISYVSTNSNVVKTFPDADGLYWCEDVAADGDYVTFSWLLSGNVFKSPGFIAFKVLAKTSDGDVDKTRWNTAPAFGTILLTVPDGEDIAERYPDVITQLLERMDDIEDAVTPEAVEGYVTEYLTKNPPSGMTSEEKEQLQKNADDINGLKGEIADKATLENGVVKFWKTSTEENRTDTLLYSVDISSIGGTGGLDLENLTLSVSQVGNYQRLSMSDGTTTKNVDIPIITITDEQAQTAVTEYLDANPVQTGATQEEAEQIQKNTNDIAALKGDIIHYAKVENGILYLYNDIEMTKEILHITLPTSSGGSSSDNNDNWELISNSDETMDSVSMLSLTTDNQGESFRLKKAVLFVWVKTGEANSYINFGFEKFSWITSISGKPTGYMYRILMEKDVDGEWMVRTSRATFDRTTFLPTTDFSSEVIGKRKRYLSDFIESVFFETGSNSSYAKYSLYGVRG